MHGSDNDTRLDELHLAVVAVDATLTSALERHALDDEIARLVSRIAACQNDERGDELRAKLRTTLDTRRRVAGVVLGNSRDNSGSQ